MSWSAGLCTPCSILLTRVKCWPVTVARSRPDRPASLRTSRRRAPSASLACRAALIGAILTMRHGKLPDGLERRPAELDVRRVTGGELARVQPVPGVGQEHCEAVVE